MVEDARMLPRRNRRETPSICAALVFAVCLLSVCVSAVGNEDPNDFIRRQFEIYDPDYQMHREHFRKRLEAMSQAIAEAEAEGRKLYCSEQMYLEAKWLYGYTAHWDRLEDKLARIQQSLDDHDQSFAAAQSPIDGLWGVCYEEWFLRLSATVDGLEGMSARGEKPRYKLRPDARLDRGKKLLLWAQDLLVSDIAHTGIDNREGLVSLISTFAQGALKPYLRDMLVESMDLTNPSARLDDFSEALRFFLSGAQDPTTGYWGAWYIVEGKVIKTVDLGMTYHIIAYTKGRVEHWPKIIETTQAIEPEPYPYGWRHNGHYNNHNLFDVAKIYMFGWPHMAESDRVKIARQIASMIDWSLSNTVGPNDTFLHDPTFSDSLADEYYFGVSFFDVVGYWQSKKRFWTKSPVDERAAAMCCRLKHRIKDLGLQGWAADGAVGKLEDNCGHC